MPSVGAISVDIRATTATLRRDMADANTIVKQGSTAMSQTLDAVGKNVFTGVATGAKQLKAPIIEADDGFKKLAKSGEATGKSIYEATKLTREMSLHLVAELSPALGSVLTAATAAARGFQGFSFGVTLGATAATTIVAILGQMVAALDDATKKAVALDTAIRTMDLSGLRGQIRDSIKELDEWNKRGQTFLGWAKNFLQGGFNLITGRDPVKESAEAIAARNKLIPLENQLNDARRAGAELTERRSLAEAELARAQSQLNVPTYETMIRALGSIIDLEEQAAIAAAKWDNEFQKAAKGGEAAGPEELAGLQRQLASRITEIQTRAAAARVALEERGRAGRLDISERMNKGWVDYAQARKDATDADTAGEAAIKATEGTEYDKWIALGTKGWVDYAEARGEAADADNRGAIEWQTMLQARQQAFVQQFATVNSAITSALDDLLQGTETWGKAFERIGRAIASSLLDNVVNRGLKAVEEELFNFVRDMQQSGVWQALAKLIGFGVSAAGGGTPSLDAGAELAFSGAGEVAPHLQHGGIVRRPTFAMIGEGGPEAVVPLNRLRGGGDVTVNIQNYSGAPVDAQSKSGPNGDRVLEIVIGAVKTAVANGSWDRVMAPYNLSRQPVGR